MKKLRLHEFVLLSALIMSIAGCEKEKDDPGKQLIGKWNQVSTHTILYYDFVKTNETTYTYSPGEYVLEIYEDGTASRFLNGKLSSSYYWSVEGDLFLMTWDTGVVLKTQFTVDNTALKLSWGVEESSDGHTTRSDYESIYERD